MNRPAAILLFTFLVGCGTQPYPPGLTFTDRADRVVVQLPPNPPDGPPPAGKLDEFIGRIDDLGGRTYDPRSIPNDQKQKLQQALADLFGTPGQPAVHDDESRELANALGLRAEKLAPGSIAYKRHCLQCHGLTGDGRGPTGQWVYPFPRDLRQGVFKYVSTAGTGSRKPSRDDIRRLLHDGIDRTSMPSFALLTEEDRERSIDYTIFLSVRGEVEFRLLTGLLSPNGDLGDDLAEEARLALRSVLKQWVEAESSPASVASVPTPEDANERLRPAHLESVRRGHALFTSQAVGCSGCHTDYGRQARYLWDAWGGSVRVPDLTEGVFRGGKRPVDLFHRIRGGVGPAGMPGAASLSDEQVWDLVHFIQALPTPSLLPEDVNRQVRP